MPSPPAASPSQQLGRYELIAQIASGGMGVVLLGRLAGAGGFQRLFAIKLLHAHYAQDREFIEMLLDEARIAAGIHHSNVVSIHEIGHTPEHGYFLVMDYIEGFSLADVLVASGTPGPVQWRMTNRVVIDALMGLDAAHSLADADGRALQVVHRDVSPENILVGVDGVSRVADFGVARARARIGHSQVGQLKGKLPYMAPEQARGEKVDARTDLFAMGIVLWESLSGRRLFKKENVQRTADALLLDEIPSVAKVAPDVPPALEAVCSRALQRDPADRFQTAKDMARALEVASRAHRHLADVHEVGAWLRKKFGTQLERRRGAIRAATGAGSGRLELSDPLPGGLSVPRLPDHSIAPAQPTQNLRTPAAQAILRRPAPSAPTPSATDDADADRKLLGDDGPSLTPVRPMETVSVLLAAAGLDVPVKASRPAAAPVAVAVKAPPPPARPVVPSVPPPSLEEEPTKTPVNDMRTVAALLIASAQEPDDEATMELNDEPTQISSGPPDVDEATRKAAAAAYRAQLNARAARANASATSPPGKAPATAAKNTSASSQRTPAAKNASTSSQRTPATPVAAPVPNPDDYVDETTLRRDPRVAPRANNTARLAEPVASVAQPPAESRQTRRAWWVLLAAIGLLLAAVVVAARAS